MKPYFETALGKLYNMDCLEYMQGMEDKSVDLVLTDPPYGIGKDGQKECFCRNSKHDRKAHEFMGWDKEIPKKEYFDEMFRVSKNQIIWGGNYFVECLKPSMGWLFWDKGQNLNQSDGELAYTSFNKALRRKVMNRVELLKDDTFHPTQKPIKLMLWCLKYGEEGSIVIDPFAGSCSSIIACEKLNRKWIGIEISEKYCEIAARRINNEARQEKLF